MARQWKTEPPGGGQAPVNVAIPSLTWGTYVMESGQGLADLMADHFSQRTREVAFVVGRGFDPRMNDGVKALLNAGGSGKRDVFLLEFNEGATSPSIRYRTRVEKNREELGKLLEGIGEIRSKEIQMWTSDGRRISSRSAANVFRNVADLGDYTDLILDVSSLPRGIFFPVLAKLLHLVRSSKESGRQSQNLFVFVAENPEIDRRITDEGIDEDADYVHLFRSGGERMANATVPKVWIPVFGEGQRIQLERLYDLISPSEICPVLPSPSLNPRRGDELVAEYQELLFDRLRIEPRNFIYAAERNPFEVYRQICQTALHYDFALQPVGGARSILSSVSSKLLSIGTLLAAYELRLMAKQVAIAHIESQGYQVKEEDVVEELNSNSVIFGLWLLGDCYA